MSEAHEWTFFTNHAHVMVSLARNPEQPLREVAQAVGITERAVLRIVAELEESGYIKRHKNGRQNTYEMHVDFPLRHSLESNCTLGDILALIVPETADIPK